MSRKPPGKIADSALIEGLLSGEADIQPGQGASNCPIAAVRGD
jgi:hypothetical protein